jgi:hypothetical protein
MGFITSTRGVEAGGEESLSPCTFGSAARRKILSMRSSELVALKKSKVFWISRRCSRRPLQDRGRFSRAAPSTRPPRFSDSAWSKERFRSFWIASVYWLPPTAMSRLKIEVAALEDVDVHDRGAHVQQRDDSPGSTP